MNSESGLWTTGQLSLLFKWLIQEFWAWEILQGLSLDITEYNHKAYEMVFPKYIQGDLFEVGQNQRFFFLIAWDMSSYDSQQLKILRTLLLNILLASLFRQGKYHWGLYVVSHLIELIVLMTMKLMKVMKVNTSTCYVSDTIILRILHISIIVILWLFMSFLGRALV